eukprot:510170-Lingulodinium_polyedra.AAC.1
MPRRVLSNFEICENPPDAQCHQESVVFGIGATAGACPGGKGIVKRKATSASPWHQTAPT